MPNFVQIRINLLYIFIFIIDYCCNNYANKCHFLMLKNRYSDLVIMNVTKRYGIVDLHFVHNSAIIMYEKGGVLYAAD